MDGSGAEQPMGESSNMGAARQFIVFVRDLTLDAVIGIHAHEHSDPQPIRINIELEVLLPSEIADSYANVLGYDVVARRAEEIVASGHVKLVETLAERIAAACLEDSRVQVARVRIEKLAAVARTASVGVAIERRRRG
jgi:dihydroneopterin aldolase